MFTNSIKWLVNKDIPLSVYSDFAMQPADPLTLTWVATTHKYF